jgi:hypothetical protein
VGNCHADHTAPSIHKGWYLLTSGGCSVGIVRLRTKAAQFKYCQLLLYCHIIISVLLYYYCIILLLLSHVLLYCHIINSVFYYYYYIIILILCINLWLVPYHVKWSVDEINWIEMNWHFADLTKHVMKKQTGGRKRLLIVNWHQSHTYHEDLRWEKVNASEIPGQTILTFMTKKYWLTVTTRDAETSGTKQNSLVCT